MKFINPAIHGFMDYAMGLLLIAGSYLLGLDPNAPESMVLYAFSGAAIVYSLLTDYPLGMIRLIPMKVHLILDVLSGLLLAASPWLLGFADRVFLPHLFLGIIEILAGLTTTTNSREDSNLI